MPAAWDSEWTLVDDDRLAAPTSESPEQRLSLSMPMQRRVVVLPSFVKRKISSYTGGSLRSLPFVSRAWFVAWIEQRVEQQAPWRIVERRQWATALLFFRAHPEKLRSTDRHGDSALHWAVWYSHGGTRTAVRCGTVAARARAAVKQLLVLAPAGAARWRGAEGMALAHVQAEPDKKPTAVDTAPVFGVRESRSHAWFS